ncbi:MAG: DUF6497 family protein [Shimia sp.]
MDAPSGTELTFYDSFWEQQDDRWIARFRFIAPAIGDEARYVDVADDFPYLCNEHALRALDGQEAPDEIVISLASEPIEFGLTDPNITQFFEAFTVEDGHCVWDLF